MSGEVANEAQSQRLASRMSSQLNPTHMMRNGEQQQLDAARADRIVEFQPGNAVLTAVGLRMLEELLPVQDRFKDRRFRVIGHTDAQDGAEQNWSLSAERATSVQSFLIGKGIGADAIIASGAYVERPVADNATVEGHARNRRIEFQMLP